MDRNDDVIAFYEEHYLEDARSAREPLEFMRSKQIIGRYLDRAPMQIADIGGATGVYSFWLAEQGHSVHLLDLVPKHIEQAEQRALDQGVSLASYTCADARHLPYADGQFDMVLQMGALYHLEGAEDRQQALSESYRVLKEGGVMISTMICRFSGIISAFKYRVQDMVQELDAYLDSGRFETKPFYCHKPAQMTEELKRAGFVDGQLIAVEGFANGLILDEIMEDDEWRPLLLKYIERTESVPEMLGVSRNIMAIGHKRTARG